MRVLLTALAVLATATLPASATDVLERAETCARIDDSLKRLACFDRLFPFSDDVSPMVSACEEAIRRTLKSPSSYVRVGLRERAEEVDLASYKDERLFFIRDNFAPDTAVEMRVRLNERIAEMEKAGHKPIRFVKTIEYDAVNAFGVPLRRAASCTYVSEAGQEQEATALTVELD